MATNTPTQLPAYIQMRYEENGVFDRLESDAEAAAALTSRKFEQSFTTIQGGAGKLAQILPAQLGSALGSATDDFERQFNAMQQKITRSLAQAGKRGDGVTRAVDVLDVAGAQQEAQALQGKANAAQEVADAMRRAAEAEGAYSQSARINVAAAEAVAVEQRAAAAAAHDHAAMLQQVQAQLSDEAMASTRTAGATKLLASANDNATDSSGRHRAAMQNLSYQLQDVAIQAQMGTSWFTIMAQQGGSIVSALAEMSAAGGTAGQGISKAGEAADEAGVDIEGLGEQAIGVAEKVENTGSRMGRFAAFLGGPWGAALVVGVSVLGPLIASLADTGDEADTTSKKVDGLTDSLDRLRQAQGRVTMQQLGYAQADVFEKQTAVSQLDRTIKTASGNVGLAAGVRSLELKRDDAQQELEDAQALLKVSQMRADIQAKADAADRSAVDGKKRAAEDDRAAKAAERAAKAAERKAAADQAAGEKAIETIRRTTEQFDEQPKAIDQAARATRDLDAVIADLGKHKPAGFAEMIEQARDAKDVVADSLLRPLEEMRKESERRLQVQDLLTAGRDDEAAALQAVWSIEDKLGSEEELRAKMQDLITAGRKDEAAIFERLLASYPAMKREAAELAQIEEERTRQAERQRALFEAQLHVIDTARTSLTDMLSGRKTDFLGSMKQSLKDLQGARLADEIFGGVFQELEDQLRQRSPLGKATGRLTEGVDTAGKKLEDLATAVEGATKRIGAAGTDAVSASLVDGNAVTVPGTRPSASPAAKTGATDLTKLTIQQLAEKTAHATVDPLLAGFDHTMGTTFFQNLSGTLSGALAGAMTGGTVGGAVGGLRGMVFDYGPDVFGKGMTEKLLGRFDDALGGVQTGSMAAGLMKGIGLKTSSTGAQIGGALGGLTGIPGGDIIGSIAGGLLGGLLKGNRTANAVITNANGYTQGGKDNGNYGTVAGLGDSVIGNLTNIVDKLGGTVGSFMVSIGTRGDEYRVNPNGTSLKIDKGAISFGDDAEAAIAFAVKNAIEDGALKGMRASTLNIIKAGDDLEAALQDALDWENVFRELKSIKDPLGSAMDDLDKEFERYIDLAKTAGASAAEMADLQELYSIKQAQAAEDYKDRILGSLQGLLDGLTTGDNGLSLRDRRAAALGTYDGLAARVKAGDSSAYDDYASAAQQLLDIERDLYGSQQEYFDRLNEVTDLTKTRIDAETNVVSIAENRDSPFDATGAVKSSIDTQTDQTVSRLDAVNENLGRALSFLSQIAANGGTMPSSGSPRISLPSYF
ncbi:hypothetical protein V474_22750 [Novosphingobium barchaimii LL02]|uniref:Bacteriophage tail tape measure N-terminal domain-containing protein n=1 Tax=Novosphingobium barchaimii LL02 TaxID=1114963 RepID=A0A0J7XRD4_9SPHN|nr:phage tail length tape measure family protein [Novosphingobium barchaimii]KMS53603.1 hypothetical protein V474_22750 [Novosphingobium barchaimii LL02]